MTKYLIIAFIILSLGGVVAFQQNMISALNKEIGVLETANAIKDKTIAVLEDRMIKLGELQEEINVIRKENGKLEQLLSKHDLKTLAKRKPALIEKRINKATKELFDELQDTFNGSY